MTKNWDTTDDSNATTPNGRVNQRAIEYYAADIAYARVWIDNSGNLIYSYGNEDAWTNEEMVGASGITGLNTSVSNASLAIDHNNGHVHIVYIDSINNYVYHSELTNLDAPDTATNWTDYGTSQYYQRVDNTSNPKGSCAIAVDGNSGNGTNSPHVVWDEYVSATWEIHYNYGNGASHAFTAGSNIALANSGETDPTITIPEPSGRAIYVFWIESTPSIECVRCTDANAPLTAANWGGPNAGAGSGPDTVITKETGDTTMSPPSASHWWDGADERVGVLTICGNTSNYPKTNMWDELATAWTGQYTASGYTGTPVLGLLQNIDDANKWRLVYMVSGGTMYHAYSGDDIDFGDGPSWYQMATTTASGTAAQFSGEFRDRSDAATAESRTGVVWKDSSNNMWYSHIRPNTTPTISAINPSGGDYKDETTALTFYWDFADTDGDSQREYYCIIDDDSGFGSPVGDPGSGLRLNTWTVFGGENANLTAGTLTANTTYYWKIKVRDGEYGTEYDPNSESAYSTAVNFKTTAQVSITVLSGHQQANKSVTIDYYISLPTGMFSGSYAEISLAEYNDGGGYATMTADTAEHIPTDQTTLPVSAGINYFTYGWNADSDLAAYFDSTATVRLNARWKNNSHGLGTVNDTDTVSVDYAPPDSTTLGSPVGGTTTLALPTLNVSATDTNGYEAKFEVYEDSGYTILHEASGYLGVGTTSYTLTIALTHGGSWYVRVLTRDGSPSQNELGSWVTGNFTYSPPPTPSNCLDGTWSISIDPNRTWAGDEFDVLDDCIDTVTLALRQNAAHSLHFTLNNFNGRYMDSSSATRIKKGDEVKMVRTNKNFYGVIKSIESSTKDNRTVDVYCESFAGAADAFPIQLRTASTATSGMDWEDYIKLGLFQNGLIPKWFTLVDGSGNEIFIDTEEEKTPVLSTSDVVFDRVTMVQFLNEIAQRTGKIWYEGTTPPPGRKSYVYWTDISNPNEGTADHTFYLEKDVISESLVYDESSLVNRVVFTDADVMEQDMESIRTYGVHTEYRSTEGIDDKEKLAEIAQYVLSEKSTPRASGSLPLEGEPTISLNQLVAIYEETSDDVKTGFEGNFVVVGITYIFSDTTRTVIELTSRWENPIIKEINALMKTAKSSGANDPLVMMRIETAQVRLECPTDSAVMTTTASDTAGRADIDMASDEDTDSDYITIYGGPT